jgi:hypothetical protein
MLGVDEVAVFSIKFSESLYAGKTDVFIPQWCFAIFSDLQGCG